MRENYGNKEWKENVPKVAKLQVCSYRDRPSVTDSIQPVAENVGATVSTGINVVSQERECFFVHYRIFKT
jgi:hypothetical protein